MGQDQNLNRDKTLTKKFLQITEVFKRDPRLIQSTDFIPQLFEGTANTQIKYIQKMLNALQKHALFNPMVDGINDRFAQRPRTIQQKVPPKQIVRFYELQNIELFYELVKKIQKWFYIEKQIAQVFNNNKDIPRKTRKITIRKKIIPSYTSTINIDLISLLYVHYYLLIVKKSITSKQTQRKKKISQFHKSIGRLILKMISKKDLNEQKLRQFTYNIICIQKINSYAKFESILSGIQKQFQPIYLQKQHSIGVDKEQIEKYQQISRCYLNQLYLKSLKEATDPDILNDSQQIGIIRTFPINRVKDKI